MFHADSYLSKIIYMVMIHYFSDKIITYQAAPRKISANNSMDAQVSMPLAPLDKKNSDIEQQQYSKKNINTQEMLIFEKENGTNGLGILTHDEDEDDVHDYTGEHSDSSEEINNSSSDLKPNESNGSISSIIEPTDCMLSDTAKVRSTEETDSHFHEGESVNCETIEHKEPKKDNEDGDEDLPTSPINPLVKNEEVKNEDITKEDVKIEAVKDEELVQKSSVKIGESERESCRGIDGSINLKKEVLMNSLENSPDPSSKKMGNAVKVELKPKPTLENLSPLARLLHDIGLEMVRQQVYKGLIGIQLAKDAENKLTDTEKGQLVKLEEAHSKLQSKNAAYTLRSNKKCRCRTFSSTSRHALILHQEYGFVRKSMHGCCCCEEYKTRWPSHFILHMKDVHSKIGRLRKKMSPFRCVYCPYEGKNQVKMDAHLNACTKRFILSSNLQPLPSECDIPLMSKRKPAALLPKPVAQPARTQQLMPQSIIAGSSFSASPQFQPASDDHIITETTHVCSLQPECFFVGVYGRSLQSQWFGCKSSPFSNEVGCSKPSHATSSGQQKSTSTVTMKPKLQGENCELCGFAVYSREILWNHLKVAHKVELNKASMLAQDPVVCCDLCPSKFWTYQGQVRHSLLVHKRSMTPSSQTSGFVALCHLCGESQTTNPLSHLSSRHNITLLDMYQARQCCICNKTMRTGQAFQAHMVLYHHDIFANKDVLHTVLQALSAARYLKREESLQHTSKSPKHPMPGQSVDGRKHPMPGQSMDGRKHPVLGQSMDGRKHPMPGQSMDGGTHPMPGQTMDGRKHPMPGQSMDGRKHPMPGQSMDGRKHPMPGQSMDGKKNPMPGQSMDGRKHPMPAHSIDGKKNPMPGQSMDDRKRPTSGQSVDGKKMVHSRRPSVPAPVTVSPPEPVVEKKSAEEDKRELDKLYEDLANIGRPILRSMRQKTPLSSSKRSSSERGKRKEDDSKDDSEEPPAKKTCVEKLDFSNSSVSASENNAIKETSDVHLNEEVSAD